MKIRKRLVLFDFDGTLTTRDSINEFLRFHIGAAGFLSIVVRNCIDILLYIVGLKNNTEIKRVILGRYLRGISNKKFHQKCVEFVHEGLPFILSTNALLALHAHIQRGDRVIITSASPEDWIYLWAKQYNVEVIATKLGRQKNTLTGEITFNNFGIEKVVAISQRIPNVKDYEVWVYTDSHSDDPLLSLADVQWYRSFPKDPFKNYAIVTDGLWRKSLSVIRSLGKIGTHVIVQGDSWLTTGFWSRFTDQRWHIPVHSDSQNFEFALRKRILALPKKPILFPMEDTTLQTVCNHRQWYEKNTFVLLPSDHSLEIAQSKSKTVLVAKKLGIRCPKTFSPDTLESFLKIIKTRNSENWIVKPHSGSGSAGILYDLQRSPQFWRRHWSKFGRLLIQERIPSSGDAIGICLLYDKRNTCIAQFVHKRLQQYPNSGGPSTDRVSILEPYLLKESKKLLEELRWQGVAMVEWKVDPNTSQPKLMEINPRFWGSLELAIRAGVNFPALYAKAAMGEKLSPQREYSVGVRCRWMIPGEILRYLTGTNREAITVFLSGLPTLAEEWDPQDVRGSIAVVICTFGQALLPKNWKYLQRG